MARGAAARRSFEDRIQMAGFAGQIPVNTIEFKTGREVIERNRDRRSRPDRNPWEYQDYQGDRPTDASRCCTTLLHGDAYWVFAPFHEELV